MSIIDISKIAIPEWKLVIEIRAPENEQGSYVAKVNDKVITLPYIYGTSLKHTQNVLSIDYDAGKKNLRVATSFGLRVTYGGNGGSSDISIDTPQTWNGKLGGLLGSQAQNGNLALRIDASGKPQAIEDKFSVAYGDTWLVDLSHARTPEDYKRLHEQFAQIAAKVDDATKQKINSFCKANIAAIQNCVQKVGHAPLNVEDCVTDLLMLEDTDEHKKYVTSLVEKFDTRCENDDLHAFLV